MPLVEDIIDQVGEAEFLSKIDLSKGFYQVPIHLKDLDETAFGTPFGKFRFRRMPFGLVNAPSTFQRLMQTVLGGQEDHCSPYIDDILVFSKSWEEHLCHLRLVLGSLRKHGLTAKPCKCVWAAKELEYLGHVVGRGCVLVPEAKGTGH